MMARKRKVVAMNHDPHSSLLVEENHRTRRAWLKTFLNKLLRVNFFPTAGGLPHSVEPLLQPHHSSVGKFYKNLFIADWDEVRLSYIDEHQLGNKGAVVGLGDQCGAQRRSDRRRVLCQVTPRLSRGLRCGTEWAPVRRKMWKLDVANRWEGGAVETAR